MKTTTHYKDHKWTNEELRLLMRMWAEEKTLEEISEALNSTPYAISKMVVKLRRQGVPLARRKKGHVAGRKNASWTQGEVEFLYRRRQESATAETIAMELGRTYHSVNAMILKLRGEGVKVPMLGSGVRKLWDATALQTMAIVNFPEQQAEANG